MQQQQQAINLLESGNKYSREDRNNDTEYVNFYFDNDKILRSFFGYKTIFEDKRNAPFIKVLIDRTGNYLYLVSVDGFTIIDKAFKVFSKLPFIINQDMPEHIPNELSMSIVEDANGNAVITSGGTAGIFLVTIERNNRNVIISASMKQLDYTADYQQTQITLWDETTKKITALYLPTFVEYLDTKIIIIDSYSGKFYIFTNLFTNAPSLNPNDFSIQSIPCDVIAVARVKRTLCVIGTKCVEFWYSSDDNIGLSRYSNQLIESGTIFPNSVTVLNGKLLYLGCNENSSPSVTIVDFNQPNEMTIEKNNLSFFFENIETNSTVKAYNFSPSDLNFYVLNVNNRTLLIDIDSHNHTYLSETGVNRFIANDIFRFGNEWYFISSKPAIHNMSSSIASYDGKPIPLNITTGIIRTENNDTFGIESIDFAIRPISAYTQDFAKQEQLKETEKSLYHIYCQFSKTIGSNKDLSTEFELRILPREIFASSIKDSRFPQGRILLQASFRFLQPIIKNQYLPFAIQTFNLNLL